MADLNPGVNTRESTSSSLKSCGNDLTAFDGCDEVLTLADDLARQANDLGAGVVAGQTFDPRPQVARGHFFDDLFLQELCRPVVHFLEIRRNPGLHRKATQDRGAKGVDGLNFQATGRFDRTCEQSPCLSQIRCAHHAKRIEFGLQVIITKHRPSAEALEQPVLHLARRGLGIGEAKNVARLDAIEQKARDAIRQHACFSGPGIGRQPGVPAGIGRFDLTLCRFVPAHRPTSSPLGSAV